MTTHEFSAKRVSRARIVIRHARPTLVDEAMNIAEAVRYADPDIDPAQEAHPCPFCKNILTPDSLKSDHSTDCALIVFGNAIDAFATAAETAMPGREGNHG